MFLTLEYLETKHIRTSKLGNNHEYSRQKTVVVFRCDSCAEIFKRDKGNMSPKRLSNNYFHVCGNCDSKRFAQRKGVERKHIWDMPASSLKDISQL
jgi:hypothetical protein